MEESVIYRRRRRPLVSCLPGGRRQAYSGTSVRRRVCDEMMMGAAAHALWLRYGGTARLLLITQARRMTWNAVGDCKGCVGVCVGARWMRVRSCDGRCGRLLVAVQISPAQSALSLLSLVRHFVSQTHTAARNLAFSPPAHLSLSPRFGGRMSACCTRICLSPRQHCSAPTASQQ